MYPYSTKPTAFLLVFIAFFTFQDTCFAQEKVLTLREVVNQAKEQSLPAKQADNRKENRYWQYRTYLSNYKPQLTLSGSVPSFSRQFSPITQEDGSIVFRSLSQNYSTVGLDLRQTIAATGAQIFVSSELQRFDNFETDFSSYNGVPFSIGISQPIFAFNQLKWDRKIEPLRYEESQKQYNEDFEQVAMQANGLFFNLLLAQVSLELAEKNLANNDTIYKIAEGRYQLGKIAENELLQLELNLITSKQQVSQAKLDLETSTLNLNTYIGEGENQSLRLIEPKEIPEFSVDSDKALEEAKKNRQRYLSFKRQTIEAERDVARAKGETGLNMDLTGNFGLSQSASDIPGIYQDPQNQQNIRLGFSIPIMDFGRQKARVKTALANQELVKSTIEQEENNFEQEIYVKVKQFPILKQRLEAAIRADEVAAKRYEIAQNRYLVSKISITDLNIALQEKDRAKQNYLQAMRDFWNAYYEIRMITLYDFEKNQPIGYE